MREAEVCDEVRDGYSGGVRGGGEPYVSEEEHPGRRAGAMSAERAPDKFWAKLTAGKPINAPAAVRGLLAASLPNRRLPFRTVHRVAGLGSPGRPRYVPLASWAGGNPARAATPTPPSASQWAMARPVELAA